MIRNALPSARRRFSTMRYRVGLLLLLGLMPAMGTAGEPLVMPQVVIAECMACHTTQPALPPDPLRHPQCARCHNRGTPVSGAAGEAVDDSAGSTVGGPDLGKDKAPVEPAPTSQPDPELAKDFATITRDMVAVPGGTFILGDNSRHPDEGPTQEWTVPAFYVDKFEVTNGDYARFVMATGHRHPDHWAGNTAPQEIGNHPVTYVSWHDAREYCAWRGKRLPTEFEWEKAARGTDGLKFPWGDIFDPMVANTPQSDIGHTTPVGSFPKGASPYGAMDMAGNVWEWTNSWYLAYPGNKDVHNPNYGYTYRVLRGGSWFDCAFYKCGISAPTFNRGFFIANTKNDTFGFRCALSAPENRNGKL